MAENGGKWRHRKKSFYLALLRLIGSEALMRRKMFCLDASLAQYLAGTSFMFFAAIDLYNIARMVS